MNYISEMTKSQAAIIAGIGLLLMTVLAIFANFFVLESLIVDGDAILTSSNIIASNGLFRWGLSCLLIVAILDIVVAWALYVMLKPINRSLSLLTAIFRIVYATILGVAIASLLNVLNLLSGADYLTVFATNQLYSEVMLSINTFNNVWNIGIVFFGLHLFFLGYLVYKSENIHKIFGILLIVASFGYLIDAFGEFLIANYNLTVGMFTFIGELLFMFWLLIKGRKYE